LEEDLGDYGLRAPEGGKVCCCQYWKMVSVLRIVIWNGTAEQVTLDTGNPWILGIEVHRVWQGTSEDI